MRFRLVPSDDRFFDLFNDSARNAEDCARHLVEVISGPDRKASFDKVMECERRGDQLTTDILHRLDTTFVTPFDREDIHALAEELDDVVDDIYQVGALLRIIPVGDPLPELIEQSELCVKMAVEVVALIERLESMKDMKGLLDQIDRLESEGDAVNRRALKRLFSGEFEALEVIKWKDVISAMENALNALEDIGDVVESIVLKHA
ncbi:MAG: phosphate transport regulator [Actinomycetia bacterium]|nr:phosphate transport regulator [Actinomycetes bacterium]